MPLVAGERDPGSSGAVCWSKNVSCRRICGVYQRESPSWPVLESNFLNVQKMYDGSWPTAGRKLPDVPGCAAGTRSSGPGRYIAKNPEYFFRATSDSASPTSITP